MATSFDELLERVRSRRQLPAPAERRRIREAAGVSLRDVAAAVGVSHTAVAGWEAGATPREQRTAYAELLAELRTEEVKPDDTRPARGRRPKSRPTSRS
jgi:transcriptional regulator with XRE-family HTH domain